MDLRRWGTKANIPITGCPTPVYRADIPLVYFTPSASTTRTISWRTHPTCGFFDTTKWVLRYVLTPRLTPTRYVVQVSATVPLASVVPLIRCLSTSKMKGLIEVNRIMIWISPCLLGVSVTGLTLTPSGNSALATVALCF